jgi:biopolymer transport protein ExbB/TolQ
MSNLINIYIAGGVEYMHPITLLFLFNLCVVTYVTISHLKKKSIDKKWIETIKHIGGLALAVGTIGTLVGLFFAFDALEASKEVIPFPVIMGGLKVALITILYGLFIFFVSMIMYVAMKLKIQTNALTS